jgi:hypothetical protein
MATKAATLKADDQSTPAVRATDPERAELQRELLEEFPVLREQVRRGIRGD